MNNIGIRLHPFFLVICLLLLMGHKANAQMTNQNSFRLPQLYQDNGDGFVVIAHRGASAYYPENTMAAFKGAVEMGAEMIELDIMLSSDGIPVAFHDAHLNDHTNGNGELRNLTLKELRQLDAGAWFDPRFAGEQIPTLEEVLDFAAGKIALNIEIKTEAVTDSLRGGVEEKSLELVKKYGMQEHVLFSSFDYRAIAHLKELAPEMPAAILYEKEQSGSKKPSELIEQFGADAFNCSYRELNRKRLRDIRQNNIPVFIYTVDEPRRMRRLIKKGVTGIFTNKPDLLWEILAQEKK